METVQTIPAQPIPDLGRLDPIPTPTTEHAVYKSYPPPLVAYEDIVRDAKLFWETLEKLHLSLGTKSMIPTIGGKELDLHKLFVEVTSRGGVEKVVRERKWKEVTSSFNFPATATNASFVLRKYYLLLLNHYEQLYFFKSEGWTEPLNASPATVADPHAAVLSPVQVQAETPSSSRNAQLTGHKRKSITDHPRPGVGRYVHGVIDGKIEDAYLISVQVGSDVLRGVVYHVNDNSVSPAPITTYSTKDPIWGRRRKRRRNLSKLDPTHPKPNRSGYNFFFAEQHAKLRLIHSGKDREISKMIGESWNKLTENEKAVYQEMGARDRERYKGEMVIYRERQKGGSFISNAVPIQQIPADLSAPNPNGNHGMEEHVEPSLTGSDAHDSTESDFGMEEAAEVEMDLDSGSLVDDLSNGIPHIENEVRTGSMAADVVPDVGGGE